MTTTDETQGETPKVGVPDMIRIMGDGSIAVDDEQWLGASIPNGTPFYSGAAIAKLEAELDDARERARSLERAMEEAHSSDDMPRDGFIDMRDALVGLRVVDLVDMANLAMNRLTLRGIGEVCAAVGLRPSIELVDRHE